MKQIAFGKYVLLHRIAQGGMAELFLARSSDMAGVARLAVIKLVSSRYAEDGAFISMFEDEVRIAATLSHPNIGQVFDVGEVAGSHYLAMEYIHGKDLRAIVSQCLLSGNTVAPPIAAHIGAKICSALQYAHEARDLRGHLLHLIHRDVSPSNIMVTFDGQVKLVDFGIAKAANRSSLTLPGMIKGKMRYLSPEQILGQEIDRRSDLFTLGTSLWEATVGQHLFDGQLEMQIYDAIANGKVRPPSALVPNYPAELEGILLKALSTKMEDRYAEARQMQLDLEAVVKNAGFSLTSSELSRFMHQIYPKETAAWQQAQTEGKSLLEHLISIAAAVEGKGDLDNVLSVEDERKTLLDIGADEGEKTEVSLAPEKGEGLPYQAPRKTMVSSEQEQPAVGPSAAEMGETVDDQSTKLPPSPQAGHYQVSGIETIAITPDGKVKVISQDLARMTRDEEDRRPTVLAGMGLDLFDAKTYPPLSPPAIVDEAGRMTEAYVPLKPGSDVAQDQRGSDVHLEQWKSANREELAEKQAEETADKDEEKQLEPTRKANLSTGDWAHQATAQGAKRVGTHPYFHELQPFPPAGEQEEIPVARLRAARVVVITLALITVGSILVLWFIHRPRITDGVAEKKVGVKKEAPRVIRVESLSYPVQLISEPSGATVYDASDGQELGKTPSVIKLGEEKRKKVEVRLGGYEIQSVLLTLEPNPRKIVLNPEPGFERPVDSSSGRSALQKKPTPPPRRPSRRSQLKKVKQAKEVIHVKQLKQANTIGPKTKHRPPAKFTPRIPAEDLKDPFR